MSSKELKYIRSVIWSHLIKASLRRVYVEIHFVPPGHRQIGSMQIMEQESLLPHSLWKKVQTEWYF